MSTIIGKHITAARGLLRMTQDELATASGLDVVTISNFENGTRIPRRATIEAIRMALENRGIEFSNGDSPGVKLRPERAIIPV